MITEDYCSFEVAKLFKEKGFDEYCLKNYWSSDKELHDWKWELSYNRNSDGNRNTKDCAAPTHQMAMAWLREKDIRICPDYSDVDGKWFTMIGTKKKRTYSGYYDTYEEAIEAALKYSLENLI